MVDHKTTNHKSRWLVLHRNTEELPEPKEDQAPLQEGTNKEEGPKDHLTISLKEREQYF